MENAATAEERRHAFAETIREAWYRLLLGQLRWRNTMLPAISTAGNFALLFESRIVRQLFDRALAGAGGPPDWVRAIDGMSGQKYRTFISELVKSLPDARYLEVGSFVGSTAAAALAGNDVTAVCIDNWSQFGGPKEAFLANMERVRSSSPGVDFRFIEDDFRRTDFNSIGRFNIYLFDGPHQEQDQYDGIIMATPALDRRVILIVDDWNWAASRLGTFRAIRAAGYSITCSVEIRTTLDNLHAANYGKASDWHNGYFFAVLTKRH
jgi:hypothetical protein